MTIKQCEDIKQHLKTEKDGKKWQIRHIPSNEIVMNGLSSRASSDFAVSALSSIPLDWSSANIRELWCALPDNIGRALIDIRSEARQ